MFLHAQLKKKSQLQISHKSILNQLPKFFYAIMLHAIGNKVFELKKLI